MKVGDANGLPPLHASIAAEPWHGKHRDTVAEFQRRQIVFWATLCIFASLYIQTRSEAIQGGSFSCRLSAHGSTLYRAVIRQ